MRDDFNQTAKEKLDYRVGSNVQIRIAAGRQVDQKKM